MTEIRRVLLVQVDEAEAKQRNRSRVYIGNDQYTLIDLMVSNDLDDAEGNEIIKRAIQLSGLSPSGGMDIETIGANIGIMRSNIPNITAYSLPDMLVYEDVPFDMIIEIAAQAAPDYGDVSTMNPQINKDNPTENPLILFTGNKGRQASSDPQPQPERERQAARRGVEKDERLAGKPGRVRRPWLDGRLKQNRTARMPQDRSNDSHDNGRGNGPEATAG